MKIAKRFVDQNSYPWINFWLRLAANALARHKEEYIFDFITPAGPGFPNDPAALVMATRRSSGSLASPLGVITRTDSAAQDLRTTSLYVHAVLITGVVPDTL